MSPESAAWRTRTLFRSGDCCSTMARIRPCSLRRKCASAEESHLEVGHGRKSLFPAVGFSARRKHKSKREMPGPPQQNIFLLNAGERRNSQGRRPAEVWECARRPGEAAGTGS